jgi:hypothetical protein
MVSSDLTWLDIIGSLQPIFDSFIQMNIWDMNEYDAILCPIIVSFCQPFASIETLRVPNFTKDSQTLKVTKQ